MIINSFIIVRKESIGLTNNMYVSKKRFCNLIKISFMSYKNTCRTQLPLCNLPNGNIYLNQPRTSPSNFTATLRILLTITTMARCINRISRGIIKAYVCTLYYGIYPVDIKRLQLVSGNHWVLLEFHKLLPLDALGMVGY